MALHVTALLCSDLNEVSLCGFHIKFTQKKNQGIKMTARYLDFFEILTCHMEPDPEWGTRFLYGKHFSLNQDSSKQA